MGGKPPKKKLDVRAPLPSLDALKKATRPPRVDASRVAPGPRAGGAPADAAPAPGLVTGLDVEEHVNGVLDYFADDEDFDALLARLAPAAQKRLNDCIVRATGEILRAMVGRRFASAKAKQEAIRDALDRLRREVVRDPDAFGRRCVGLAGR